MLQNLLVKNDLVKRAYDFAKTAHQGQLRKSGEPYFYHAVAAAEYLWEWNLDEATIAAGLLHDVAEDTDYDIKKIRKDFGEEVAQLVDGVTKLGHFKYRGAEAEVENLRKFIIAVSEDIRVILVKLADRLHNMRTLSALPPSKQQRIALETMDIYAPLAYRLGMFRLSGELEDLAFPYLHPNEYQWLIEHVREHYEERERYAEKIKPVIEEQLQENGVDLVRTESRAKRYTSLYRKLLKHDMNLDRIYDLVAIRCLVNSLGDCYSALGVIHKIWPPLPNRVKDYIALPKSNGYRSLHTTILGPEQKITEIQIRTEPMHELAELGIAAHWAYQQNKKTREYLKDVMPIIDIREAAWVQELRNWRNHFNNPKEFLRSLKADFFKDRIMVLTPRGDVVDLPVGATPVDFAYKIHTAVGNNCAGAKVNGRLISLDTELKYGDVVEIMTQKNKKPSASWLEFVKTAHARNQIKTTLGQITVS